LDVAKKGGKKYGWDGFTYQKKVLRGTRNHRKRVAFLIIRRKDGPEGGRHETSA